MISYINGSSWGGKRREVISKIIIKNSSFIAALGMFRLYNSKPPKFPARTNKSSYGQFISFIIFLNQEAVRKCRKFIINYVFRNSRNQKYLSGHKPTPNFGSNRTPLPNPIIPQYIVANSGFFHLIVLSTIIFGIWRAKNERFNAE